MTIQSRQQSIASIIQRHDLNQTIKYPQYEALHGPNDWYAHACTIKDFAGLPQQKPLPFVIEHGYIPPMIFNDTPTPEKDSPLPLMGITTKYRIPFEESGSGKLCFAMGTINSYAKGKIDKDGQTFFKKYLGRTLLVFPSHSTATSEIGFDVDKLISCISDQSHLFDTVRFCIYWADLLKESDWITKLAQIGEIVTAGHPWDPAFQSNLRTMIELSDVVASNDAVSSLGYAAHLNKPIWVIDCGSQYSAQSAMELHDIRNLDLTNKSFDGMANYFHWHAAPKSIDPVNHSDLITCDSDLLSNIEIAAIYSLGHELVEKGYKAGPSLRHQLVELSKTTSGLEKSNLNTLRSLIDKSDRARIELEIFSRDYGTSLPFDPLSNVASKTIRTPKHQNIKVDLCCGERKPEGFIGIDCYAGKKVDIVHDLNQGFPLEDSVAAYVRGYDAIEHLREPLKTMNEIWRICQNDAIVDLMVPSTDGRGAFQDPTHVSFWNENSFMYYTIDHPDYLAHAKIYGFKGVFKLLELRSQDCGLNVIQVFVKLQAIKPTA